MWEIKLNIKHDLVCIKILFNKTVILSEDYLSIHIEGDKSLLYIGNKYNDGVNSRMWEFVKSLYKELVLYRKYGDKNDLDLDTNDILNRYYCDALIPITFSERLVDNVIFEVEKMCKSINNNHLHKYENCFIV